MLIAAIGDESREAMGEIYDRYGGAVWWVAKRVCRSAEQAEEVCQAVFTDLWSHPERFDPSRGVLRSWLVAEAHARAVDGARSEEGRRRERDPTADPTPPSAEAEVAAHAAALAKEARPAVDELAADERETILLAYAGGRTCSETARLLNVSEESVKSRIHRGLLNLQRALAAEGVTT